jgi:hypothetical protein
MRVQSYNEFVNEAMSGKPHTKYYAPESFWNEKFPGGLEAESVDRPKFKSVIASILQDLDLPGIHNGRFPRFSTMGYNIMDDTEGRVAVKNAFLGDYTYAQLKAEIEKYAKKNNIR